MLFPKKVKYRKWQRNRRNPAESRIATRGTKLSFGSFGLKALSGGRLKSNQIESSRKVISRGLGKTGKLWIRVFPDKPVTAKPPEVGMGKGKGDPQGYTFEVEPGRMLFEIDGLAEAPAREALRKAGMKLPFRTKIIARI